MSIVVHKRASPTAAPKLSIVLLDWECRERFHTLDWLNRQDVPREDYELIWVELHDRVLPVAMDKADVVITCGQQGLYHKHWGYNVGALHARGTLINICDSDAVFPPDFVRSVLRSFELQPGAAPGKAQVLMHYQWRTGHLYPDDLQEIEQLSRYKWRELWPNVGACMTVRSRDLFRFGGFDEHRSYRGYMCGPYDLGWRLVNAGLPEVWHDPSVASWHFAHPDPWFSTGELFSWRRWREKAYPHINGHALTAVEAFSTGRVLPLEENPEIHRRRMQERVVGTPFEAQYATMTGPRGFGPRRLLRLHAALWAEPFARVFSVAKERAKLLLRGPKLGKAKTQQEFWLADPDGANAPAPTRKAT